MHDRASVEALLIDSNPEDIQLFLEALKSGTVANQIHTVSTGADALDFLHQRGDYSDAPRPNLILLDIELSELSGHDVLEEVNDHPDLAVIPVIVFSGAADTEAIARLYELNVNACIQKPVGPDEFVDVVRAIEKFWLEIVWLPPETEEGSHLENSKQPE